MFIIFKIAIFMWKRVIAKIKPSSHDSSVSSQGRNALLTVCSNSDAHIDNIPENNGGDLIPSHILLLSSLENDDYYVSINPFISPQNIPVIGHQCRVIMLKDKDGHLVKLHLCFIYWIQLNSYFIQTSYEYSKLDKRYELWSSHIT